jgi:hypothetical protein
MLTEIPGRKRDEVTGECRRVYNDKIHNLNSSFNPVKAIGAKRTGCAKHVACTEDEI